MTAERAVVGPGSVRVGRFIGRLGVVSLPAVAVALDLEERVVRRHVAKLEAAGWLARAPWVWGEGSVAWLSTAGIRGTGLGAVRPLLRYPSPGTIAHGIPVGWSAARAERRGREWKSARELAVEGDRWAVPARCDRGYTTQLPDLAVWVARSRAPVAVIAECGGRRDDRQRWILEGWRDAVWSGRYSAVRYECETPSVERWIARLGTKIGLARHELATAIQRTPDEIAAMSPELARAEAEARDARPAVETVATADRLGEPAAAEAPLPPAPYLVLPRAPEPLRDPEPDQATTDRMDHWREAFAMNEPPRRRWGRRR
jgi:hypothetical protein